MLLQKLVSTHDLYVFSKLIYYYQVDVFLGKKKEIQDIICFVFLEKKKNLTTREIPISECFFFFIKFSFEKR